MSRSPGSRIKFRIQDKDICGGITSECLEVVRPCNVLFCSLRGQESPVKCAALIFDISRGRQESGVSKNKELGHLLFLKY